MTWKTFAESIEKSGLTKDKAPKILDKIFTAAGRMETFTEAAAKSWINGNRQCKVSKYFPEGVINNTETYKFFKRRPENSLKQLQQQFREKSDDDSPIDLETDDMDIFCWSLVNQFLDLLGFQRLDAPTGNMLLNKDFTSINQTCDNQKISVSENIDTDSGLIISENNAKNNMNHMNSQITFASAQLSIPEDCKICLYCKYWQDNVYDAVEGIGRCTKLNKDIESTVAKCSKFKENWGRITNYQLTQHK